ncbi:MAG: hypothetical protein PHI27_08895 [Eubacteriales bacterium]|nr:hypothetical protein [Eubacteriales bacterium]MDD3882357.1 hypothetical protein [Eubacteriales bacterium]MDD4512422.1 hypothetical protein [Eubacteriales bacterium]
MNPFKEKARPLDDCIMDWKRLCPAPYDKNTVSPYTKTRVILMNGTEFEQSWFMHQFSRHSPNGDIRRELSLIRRLEQQQQKLISLLKPADETILEHTIGYEQLAVDLTCALAKAEPDKHVRNALDFALLEDFDHLYRYADLLEMEAGVKAERLVGKYTEITPGRPTISEHRFPFDDVKPHIDSKTAALQTRLCVGIITAAEQQTMNFYMNVCGAYPNDRGRRLYQEIGMIEEQHVTQYGCLMDVNATWFECLLMHQYTECYLYWSCMETETDLAIKKIWEMLFEQEICHLSAAAELLEKAENKKWEQVIPDGEFPKPLDLGSNIPYVRDVLSRTVQLTAVRESYGSIDALEPDADFFRYQSLVNDDISEVSSHTVIDEHIKRFGEDYRFETAENPIPPLRNRVKDNTEVGRIPASLN